MARASTDTPHRDHVGDYHRHFADAIIRQIADGTAPWQKPWKPGERFMPENAFSNKPYTGGNALYLAQAGQERGFTDNRWATYRQIAQAGGHVKKGEHGEKILYFDTKKLSPKKDDNGRAVVDGDGRPVYERHDKGRAFVRTYTVFNVEQARGLDLPARGAPVADWQAHKSAEAVIEAASVTIKHAPGDRAYYSPKRDEIVLPERGQFPSAEHYYGTALHELSHATGHESRLDRETFHNAVKYPTGGFGSAPYAREELRAEIAAMMTGERIGIGHHPRDGQCGNSAAYVKSWIEALEKDPREIHRAAGEADRISRYLISPARERLDAIANEPRAVAAMAPPERPLPSRSPAAPTRDAPPLSPGR
ncbi:MAG: zincin-like metallopeptidase domain-containing protein [bacterium]|nr:zincin-like metallopeptidase domain-containing protein [bacterium]